MQNEIVEKLRIHLNSCARSLDTISEASVVYLLVEIRKLLEQEPIDHSKAQRVLLVANWAVHHKIDRTKNLRKCFEAALQKRMTQDCINPERVEQLLLTDIHDELKAILNCLGLPVDIVNNQEAWKRWTDCLKGVLTEQAAIVTLPDGRKVEMRYVLAPAGIVLKLGIPVGGQIARVATAPMAG